MSFIEGFFDEANSDHYKLW
jgi:hypothetical protein